MNSLSVLGLLLGLVSYSAAYYRVCYFTNWAQYRPGEGRYKPHNVDPFLCTHLMYSFAKLHNGKIAMYEWNDDKLYAQVQDLKKANPALKTLLAIGGWNHENGHMRFVDSICFYFYYSKVLVYQISKDLLTELLMYSLITVCSMTSHNVSLSKAYLS